MENVVGAFHWLKRREYKSGSREQGTSSETSTFEVKKETVRFFLFPPGSNTNTLKKIKGCWGGGGRLCGGCLRWELRRWEVGGGRGAGEGGLGEKRKRKESDSDDDVPSGI